MINEIGVDSNIALFLDVSKDIACKRIVGRGSCPKCHRVYNDMIAESMPKVSGKCDDCGESLIRRSDDNSETFGKRYDEYLKNTAPLIDYYKEKGILYTIDSGMGKDSVFKVIEGIIGDLND